MFFLEVVLLRRAAWDQHLETCAALRAGAASGPEPQLY